MSEAASVYEDVESADGTLVILVCRAKHLPNRRKLDKQSPYVTLRIGTTAKKTPSHFRAGQTPEWTHEIRFALTRDRRPVMRLDILDETKNDPTPIGTTEIDCAVVFLPENKRVECDRQGKQIEKYIHDKWYDLQLNGRRAGMIYLEMTFYPSVPVLPPKISLAQYPEHEMEASYRTHTPSPQGLAYGSPARSPGRSPARSPNRSLISNKDLPPAPAVDDVFVSGEIQKQNRLSAFFRNSNSSHEASGGLTPLTSSADSHDDVFDNGKKKKVSAFDKLTRKFQSREPITTLWQPSAEPLGEIPALPNNERLITPLSAYEVDNLDQLERDVQSHYYKLPASRSPVNDELDFAPPAPPPHKSQERHARSPDRRRSPARKPPPSSPSIVSDFKKLSVAPHLIPFSADQIGLDELDEDAGVPTKVYFMDQQVKLLSAAGEKSAANGAINPKFYAPTPSEHFNKSLRLQNGTVKPQDVSVDYRTHETGYVGEGKWMTDKFLPSIFDRMPLNESSNKPQIPPKIPKGMLEMEYYVLEKEKYLKDLSGRRH